MAVRVRYTRTELSEGIVEVLHQVDKFNINDDNGVELCTYDEEIHKYRVIGYIHPERWESIIVLDDVEA